MDKHDIDEKHRGEMTNKERKAGARRLSDAVQSYRADIKGGGPWLHSSKSGEKEGKAGQEEWHHDL
jgi:hypothetical protein